MENASVINELLDAAKQKTGAASDYKLAQVLDLPKQRISDYRAGSRTPDAYGCARIAEALGLDPLEVIARVEAEAAKSERARSYWRSFTGGVRRTMIVGGALWLTASFSGGAPTIGAAQAAEASTHNGRLRQRPQRKDAALRGGFFFGCWSHPSPQEKQAPRQKKHLSRHPLIFPATPSKVQGRLAFL